MRRIVFAVILGFLLPAWAMPDSGTIKGTVRDVVSGSPLAGASVSLLQPSKKDQAEVRYQAITAGNGSYEISGITPGRYAVTVVGAGLKPAAKPDVLIQKEQALVLDFLLGGY